MLETQRAQTAGRKQSTTKVEWDGLIPSPKFFIKRRKGASLPLSSPPIVNNFAAKFAASGNNLA